MPKIIATIICIILIAFLFSIDRKRGDGVSKAIWIPFIWIVFAASREFSFWLNYFFGIGSFYGTIEEGNPYERTFHSILIVLGCLVLAKRKMNWLVLLKNNVWIWLYFIFAAVSIYWSDYPYVSFKRWFKTMGTVIMVLVILTELRPYEAIGFILRRMAFVLLPLSALFIRFYPDLGRSYTHSGGSMFHGVAGQKNGLGMLCLISGIYFTWNVLMNSKRDIASGKQLHILIYFIIVPLIAWLLLTANSATSLACLIIAIFLFLAARQPIVAKKPDRIMIFGLVCVVLIGILEWIFGVTDTLIALLGRRTDLTTRVPMWQELLTMAKYPISGYGFESFWLGERQALMIEHWSIDRQAHNGYLDMYLNLGFIGLFFVLVWMLSGLRKVHHYFSVDYQNAMLRFCFIIIFAFYSWTESVFHLTSVMWTLMLIGIMDGPTSDT